MVQHVQSSTRDTYDCFVCLMIVNIFMNDSSNIRHWLKQCYGGIKIWGLGFESELI